jgi:hypothetical protein
MDSAIMVAVKRGWRMSRSAGSGEAGADDAVAAAGHWTSSIR